MQDLSNVINTFSINLNNGYDVSCFGECDASIQMGVFDLNNPNSSYTFNWYEASDLNNPISSETINSNNIIYLNTYDNLCAGTYILEYTSPTGCVKEKEVIVREPDELYISVDNYLNYSQSGTINISVNGGVGNVINHVTGDVVDFIDYNYQWFNEAGLIISQDEDVFNLSEGNYNVVVSDVNGCVAQSNFNIINDNSSNLNDTIIEFCDSIIFDGNVYYETSLIYSNLLGQVIDGEAEWDNSGHSVSLSSDGNTVAIGAYANDGNGANSGHVRIYTFNGNSWQQLGQDIDGESAQDYSGNSVSISSDGNTVAIGAYRNDGNGYGSGHVRIYTFNGNSWQQLGQDIDGEAAGDFSGISVSLSADGNTVAIGANSNDGNGSNSGHVRIYTFNGNSWQQLGQDIDGEAALDYSGNSVSLSADGNIVAVGATNNGNYYSGHVRIYTFNGNSWQQLGQDIDGEAAGDNSGYSVSISSDGNTVAIGATGNDENGSNSGHVRIYTFNGNSWQQLGQDIDGEAAGDNGSSVSLSSDGNTVAIGASFNDGNGSNSGHVRIYTFNGNSWQQLGQDIDGEAAVDYSGNSVSLSADGNIVAVGAYGNNGNGSSSGHVRIYDLTEDAQRIELVNQNFYSYDTAWVYCDFYIFNGDTLYQSGDYSYSSSNINDCDSIFNLHLSFQIPYVLNINTCNSYYWQGQTYYESGMYSAYWDDPECPSYILNLTIEGIENTSIVVDATNEYSCDGVVINQTTGGTPPYTYLWNGNSSEYVTNSCSGYNYLTIYDSQQCSYYDSVFVGPNNYGCTDVYACNYDSLANTDNGSCIYPETYYNCFDECIYDYDQDGVCDQLEIYGCTDSSSPNYDPTATEDDESCIECNIIVEYFINNSSSNFICDGIIAIILNNSDNYTITINGEIMSTSFTTSACYGHNFITIEDQIGCLFEDSIFIDANNIYYVYGCTDSTAINFNESANSDDGSCEYEELENACDITPSDLFVDNIIHNRVKFNWSEPSSYPSHYMIRYRPLGTNQWTVMTAGSVNSNPYSGTSRTRYFMEPETTYEWNIRARVLNEDGSTNCQSPWSVSSQFTTLPACPNLDNLSVSTEANWVTLNADAPGEDWGVWQSKAKMKEVGSNSFRYANGDAIGNINVLKGNFSPNTEYEWHTKAWCTGNVDELGNSDPQYHSGWGEFSSFITEEICDKLPLNLSTSSNGANTAITMSWDTPLSGDPDHYFLELNNDITGQQWQWNDIAGEQTSKTKFNLSSGDYSWRIRGACGENGTSWATIFTQPVYYTLGAERLENEIVSDLNIYPNPSSNIFNLEFNIDTEAEMLVTNVLGEQVHFESIQSIGKYNTQIDLSNYSKGIYNLTIKTSDGISNHKLILQ